MDRPRSRRSGVPKEGLFHFLTDNTTHICRTSNIVSGEVVEGATVTLAYQDTNWQTEIVKLSSKYSTVCLLQVFKQKLEFKVIIFIILKYHKFKSIILLKSSYADICLLLSLIPLLADQYSYFWPRVVHHPGSGCTHINY